MIVAVGLFVSSEPSIAQYTHDQERFLVAYDRISQGHYEEALDLLRQNMRDTPDAIDIDYDFAWATLCLAHLCRTDEFLEYYRVMRTRFYGLISEGGAIRGWDDKLGQAQIGRAHV